MACVCGATQRAMVNAVTPDSRWLRMYQRQHTSCPEKSACCLLSVCVWVLGCCCTAASSRLSANAQYNYVTHNATVWSRFNPDLTLLLRTAANKE